MIVKMENQLLDELLDSWREQLGGDFAAYRNHCFRVFNFCVALLGVTGTNIDKISIAVAYHDLGIWTHGTFDYLEPSQALAKDHLAKSGRGEWTNEVVAMIANHHKLTKVTTDQSELVEAFRKADWTDVSMGWLKHGLPESFVSEALLAFPNYGFHKKLVSLTLKRMLSHPLSPLPMLKL